MFGLGLGVKLGLADRTLDLPFFSRLNHITSLDNHHPPGPSDSWLHWLHVSSAAMFVLN